MPAVDKSPPTNHTTQTSQDKGAGAPMSPTKGELKVKRFGLKKTCSTDRTFKCQSCGKCEKTVHDLNKHHQNMHPPLMCRVCNKLFKVPSTLQLHMYNHQTQKFKSETCGQGFNFQVQLYQHNIVHRSTRTHKCMAKGCGLWFMWKADLTVHVATHDKVYCI